MNLLAPRAKNAKGLTAKQSGPCGACHIPHDAQGPKLWARAATDKLDPLEATCVACHTKEGLAKKKTVGDFSHPLNVAVQGLGISASPSQWTISHSGLESTEKSDNTLKVLPLFHSDGSTAKAGGKLACATCHDPHKWSAITNNENQEPKHRQEGTGENSFLRIPVRENSELCLNCHVNKKVVMDSKHNIALAAPEADNIEKQTTVESGLCGACHLAHNGSSYRMWARDPAKAETAGQQLCMSCHRQGNIAENHLIGKHSHPLGKPVENGLLSAMPLFLQGSHKIDAAGVMDCATCHDPHQWDPLNMADTKGMDKKVIGDARNSFLRKPAAPGGQLCLQCHKAKQSILNTDHDMSMVAPQAQNLLQQNPEQSGVCGQCHIPHHAATATRIWGQSLDQGKHKIKAQDTLQLLCLNCHQDSHIGHRKTLKEKDHPGHILVWSGEIRHGQGRENAVELPVFSVNGEREKVGRISCPTCHDAHQWSASHKQQGPGKNTEGNVLSSFLRANTTDYFVCADCHGLDGIYRYKYFHDDESHKKYPLFR